MKKVYFTVENDGFHGTYYECPQESKHTMIGLFGDDPNDYMAKCGARWLHKLGVNCMAMSPGKKDYSHVNCPIERVEKAIEKCKGFGNTRFGIMGMSTAGMYSLAAASFIPDITLTVGLTASDFVWQGFEQGKKDGCREWPVPGASTLSKDGKPLPYMPFVYEHPDYWNVIQKETKGTGNYLCSRSIFDDSEKNREHPEDEMIRIEDINGYLLLIGADDDTLWDAGKYVRRMKRRLEEKPHICKYKAITYEYGTHFVLPESMLRIALPVGLRLFMRLMFKSAKEHPDECEQTRKDIDREIREAVRIWMVEND